MSNSRAPENQSQVELLRAEPHHEPILANLLELYIHDFSEFLPLELDANGRFGYAHLPLYWSEPDRHSFLIYADSKLAGLAMVKRETDSAPWDMAEFFIVRAHRRRGVGIKAAHAVWERLPGPWQVRVMKANSAASHFWQKAIATYIHSEAEPMGLEKDGHRWLVFHFEKNLL